MVDMAGDMVQACVDLVQRTGAQGFEIGHAREGVPSEDAGWYASAFYQGTRIMEEEHRSPSAAALALAERLLSGGLCRCGQSVTLSDDTPGCRWRLMGKRWEPSCDAPSVDVDSRRGDLGAMLKAFTQPLPRRERRGRRR